MLCSLFSLATSFAICRSILFIIIHSVLSLPDQHNIPHLSPPMLIPPVVSGQGLPTEGSWELAGRLGRRESRLGRREGRLGGDRSPGGGGTTSGLRERESSSLSAALFQLTEPFVYVCFPISESRRWPWQPETHAALSQVDVSQEFFFVYY